MSNSFFRNFKNEFKKVIRNYGRKNLTRWKRSTRIFNAIPSWFLSALA